MGLGETGLLEDGDGGGCKGAAASSVSCSICFEAVTDVGDRSWAKLQCGHRFHLDCIGSAFNAKGAMQCPNCRNTEKGQWLYSNGCRPVSEFSMEDLAYDDDLYDFNYAEMSFGVHWSHFSGLSLPSPLDEGEFSSNASHPCPYVAFFGPIHPHSAPSGSISDGSSFNNHWSGPSVPSEPPNSYALHSMDAHFCPWDQSSPFPANTRIGASDQPSVTQRTHRNTSDISRPGVHPFVMSHSSAIRAPSSVPSSVLPHFPGHVARPRDRVPSLQSHFQHSGNAPAARTPPAGRRSSNHRAGMASQVASSSNQARRAFQESENHHHNRFHAWGRDYHQFPLNVVDGDSIWAPFHPLPAASGSEVGIRSNGSRQQRHGSDRSHHHQHQS